MANPVPRTEAGREWLNEEHPAGTKTLHTRHARDRMAAAILAIEAEARQQMKAETREQIFRDNGLIADPLAAASPAAPAEDYGGLIAVARNAQEQGYPIHCATRSTCSEHLEKGDDKRDNFAFGQAASPAAPAVDRAEALLEKARQWREQGMFSDAEWGAICAVFYVQDVSQITDADKEWAAAEYQRLQDTVDQVASRPGPKVNTLTHERPSDITRPNR